MIPKATWRVAAALGLLALLGGAGWGWLAALQTDKENS